MDRIQQLENATLLEDIKLESKLSVLKPLLCAWLYNAWIHIHKKRMVQIGWEKCSLLFKEEDVQVEDTIIKENMEGDIDPETTIKSIMEDSLKKLADI
jgi:hypothetical protein